MASDNAVALVRAYLQVNGYFTVTEYPVIEAVDAGGYRTVTDLDVLAYRFPGAGRFVPGAEGAAAFAPDPALEVPDERADLLVAEVKEGAARLNEAAREPNVLRTVLVRFGCCPEDEADGVVGSLLSDGKATAGPGQVRLLAFGLAPDDDRPVGVPVITLGHVIGFLQSYLREHWDLLRHAEFKDPAFGFLMTLEKGRRDGDR